MCRSVRPSLMLDLVDRVFANPLAAAGVVDAGDTLTHYADRADHAGAVELWPLTPLPDAVEPLPWTVPEQNHGLTSAPQQLADTLAHWIAREVSGNVMLESKGRPLLPGDVMVLVRRRNDFGRALVRALKSRGVPVAGLDRLMLTEQPAVQDLMALADALLLPRDDLTFACVLTSPLGGLTDDSLMELAIGRPGHLWDALRARSGERTDWHAAWTFFSALLGRVDYVTPYALFAEALGPLGGRARLLARLGPEAAEPVDELLNAALAHSRTHPPSLQAFLHWLRRSGAEVKREAESAGSLVRVMTVHGAKGLQAPLVILPDTTALPPEEGTIHWARRPRHQPQRSDLVATTRTALHRRPAPARRSCAATHRGAQPSALRRAHPRRGSAGGLRLADPARTGRCVLVPPGGTRLRSAASDPGRRRAPPCLAAACEARASSDAERLTARRRTCPLGWAVHRIGKPARHRPNQSAPSASPPAAPRMWNLARSLPPPRHWRRVTRPPTASSAASCSTPCSSTSPICRPRTAPTPPAPGSIGQAMICQPAKRTSWRAKHWRSSTIPDLAPLFAPGSRAEVPLTGVVAGMVIGGLIDRLAVLPDRVLIADFKTNRRPPSRIEDTPVLYLRQMAAYRAVLRDIFPDRGIACALVWTQAARVVMLPDELLESHTPSHASRAA